jgi:hypothetical protein
MPAFARRLELTIKMIPSARLGNVGRVLFPLLIAAGILVLPARSQQGTAGSPIKPAPITFTEITSRLHLGLPPVTRPSGTVTLPVSIRSQEYSLDYARNVLVPAIGGSIAVADLAGDGRPDLYATIPGGSNHLLHQGSDGTFLDVTDKAGVKGTGSDLAATFGDFDKSGMASLFVAGLGGVTLYRNNGDGTFTDITAKAGLKGKAGELATSVLLFDADGDGFLDVLVTIYTDFSITPKNASLAFPNDFAGAESRLYRNQHDGTFVDITDAAGLTGNPGRTHIALAADFNKNGRMDLLFLRDNKPPALFRNMGQGKFEDHTWDAGQEIWKYAYVDGQIADFDHDGKPDAALWSTIGNEVIMNQGNGKFEQEESLPLVYAANRAFGFHGLTADLNGDGFDDLLTVDNKGKWHFLPNHKGDFTEAPFAFSPAQGDEFSAMTSMHLEKTSELALVGLTKDGQIKVFEKR